MKRLIRAAIHNSGALSLWRAFHADRLRILMYHNFPDRAAGLERTCEEIRRHYTPVSMPQVAASLATGEPLPQNAVAVTIDDGYRDFLDAYSIFEKFGIPATVYLISDFLDRGSWLWWNRIDWALRHTHRRGGFSLTIGGGSRAYSLDGNRVAIAGSVCEDLKRCANSERLRAIEELIETLGVTMPTELPAEWRPLTWEEVRALSRRGVEFGAHTRTHPILGRIEDVREMRAEIEISKRRVEEELNRPATHFAYPNGQPGDFTGETLRALGELGFQTAVTTNGGMNDLKKAVAEPLHLRRIAVGPEISQWQAAELLAGVR